MAKLPKRQCNCWTGITKFPALENTLKEWIVGQRENSRAVVGQKLPDDWEEKVANFHQFVLQRKEELGIQGDHVFNMDEVPMSFDAPFSRTVDATGAQTIPVWMDGQRWTEMEWLSGVRKFGVPDQCPSLIELRYLSLTVSTHTSMKAFETITERSTKQPPQ